MGEFTAVLAGNSIENLCLTNFRERIRTNCRDGLTVSAPRAIELDEIRYGFRGTLQTA